MIVDFFVSNELFIPDRLLKFEAAHAMQQLAVFFKLYFAVKKIKLYI